MLVLFDNGTPRTLARHLIDRHAVTEARARGWEELENGALLNEAETAGFEVLVTTDKNLRYQQNLDTRKIAIVVLAKGRWSLDFVSHPSGGEDGCVLEVFNAVGKSLAVITAPLSAIEPLNSNEILSVRSLAPAA